MKQERIQRTYRLYPQMTDRLKKTAERFDVGASDLLGYILQDGLNRIDDGTLPVPTKAARTIVDYKPLAE